MESPGLGRLSDEFDLLATLQRLQADEQACNFTGRPYPDDLRWPIYSLKGHRPESLTIDHSRVGLAAWGGFAPLVLKV